MPAFLLEIGVEEIPDGMIAAAQAELERGFRELIERERLASEGFAVRSYSTPRRLAVVAEGLLAKQADLEEQVIGPSTKVAYKDGAPTPAAVAFAKKSGVDVAALETITNAKGEYVAANVRRVGCTAGDVLAAELPGAISGIYWPKNMYWRTGKPERFVRPVRWLLALLDEEIVPVQFAGLTADGVSYGHRVLHGDAPVVVKRPGEYAAALKAAFVQVDVEARRQHIRKALDAATRQIPGARWREDEALVDTVTNLTEWPSVMLGSFDASYLDLPEEVLVTVMRDHQKYFALEDSNKELLPNFLAVLNVQVDAAGEATIRHGNERVLRARFNDARFFWNQDQKIPLVDRVEMLKHVTFHKDLGSYWDKTERNRRLVEWIAMRLYARGGKHPDVGLDKFYEPLFRATELAKADLTTEMVKEFPELQGIVGGLYAKRQGESDEVASAIYEQYKPVSASDSIPTTRMGCILAMADRLATIAETFSIDLQPTGSKDPLALRRAGNGVIRILIENEEIGSRLHLVSIVFACFGQSENELTRKVYEFLLDRFEFHLQSSLKLRLQVTRAIRNSVIASMETGVNRSQDKVGENIGPDYGFAKVAGFAKVLNEQVGSSALVAVAELFKRISNILRQAREKKLDHADRESASLLKEPQEIDLAERATKADAEIQKNYRDGKYGEVIAAIAALQQPLNSFFDSVMVMVDNPEIRANRLALLARTEATVRWAADFSELASL